MEFMSLPLEIRLLILNFAVCLPLAAPTCPSASQHGRRCVTNKKGDIISQQRSVWQLPITNPALNLLLVNHQLHAEVKDALRFVPARYHVDIMFVKTHGLWPTWSIPAMPRGQYIDTVSCTLRIFEPTPDLGQRFAKCISFRHGDGGPASGVWSFYSLLTQLFDFGPGFTLAEPRNSRYIVKTIIIDIVAPVDGAIHSSFSRSEEELKGMPEARRRLWSYEGKRRENTTIEETLATYLVTYLESLIRLGYSTDKYGMLIWQCVLDRIVFLVDGKELKSFDMEEICQTHVPSWWGTTPEFMQRRKRDWGVWRTWIMERRRKMRDGLEVEDDSPVQSFM